MQIQLNTDHNVHRDPSVERHVEQTVASALERFGDRITRVEVHLRDENGPRGGEQDQVCTMEARPSGHQPVAVTDKAATIAAAVTGAARKLQHVLASSLSH